MEKLEWLGYHKVKKNSKISLFVLAQLTNVTDGQTDGHRVPAIAAVCIASHGKNCFIHRQPREHLCRRYMRSTECPSSFSILVR